MTAWYLLLAPILVLAVLLLLRFVGCDLVFTVPDRPAAPNPSTDYPDAVRADTPVAYFRLQETSGTDAINDSGPPNGAFEKAPGQVDAGERDWRSTGLFVEELELALAVASPALLKGGDLSIRVRGADVKVPANAAPLNHLTEFTVEAMVLPQWDTVAARAKYYCVLELAEYLPGAGQKNAGFGLYAGPQDPFNANSPGVWQFWMGVGPQGFTRVTEVLPYVPDDPNDPNPGPTVVPEPTYLAVTYSQSQAFLYLYNDSRHVSYTTYELNVVPYVPSSSNLLIGMVDQGPLFPPTSAPRLLYPFLGQISNVAIYDKVLTPERIMAHGIAAFDS